MIRDSQAKRIVQRLLSPAGIVLDGHQAWDIRIHNTDFYKRILRGGSLALGESYMDGWWDCPALDQFIDRLLRSDLDRRYRALNFLNPNALRERIAASQSRSRAFEIGRRHYDLDNTFFAAMLDSGMNYSCAYWQNAADLDAAQTAKLDMICQKLELSPGMKVLDIGCGWGGFAIHAAAKYGVHVTGITVSREQAALARERAAGLPVQIKLQDYRSLSGSFERIVSIGMFEHVGHAKYGVYMKDVCRCLKPGGLFLLQTIGSNISVRAVDPWFARYIFPNSMLPSPRQVTAAAEKHLVLEDWHSFGPHYDRTLMAWYDNFTRAWPRIAAGYSNRFYRMWCYYLLVSAGAFRARKNQLWQIVFSKDGLPGGYSPRRYSEQPAILPPVHQQALAGDIAGLDAGQESGCSTKFGRLSDHPARI